MGGGRTYGLTTLVVKLLSGLKTSQEIWLHSGMQPNVINHHFIQFNNSQNSNISFPMFIVDAQLTEFFCIKITTLNFENIEYFNCQSDVKYFNN